MSDDVTAGTHPPEKTGGKAAKILYRPVGLASSIVGGLVAGQVFKQVYKRVTPGHRSDAPKPLESEYSLRETWPSLFLSQVEKFFVSHVSPETSARLT